MTEQTVSEKSTGKSTENATVRVRGAVPDVPRETWWQRLWTPFWMIPAVSVIAAVVLGVLLPSYEARDAGDPLRFAFEGGPDAAREVLGVIASATISVTGLVFSITLVVLQLVNSSFSPRMMDGFLRSRTVQGTLAIWLSTFVFALTVTRYVWNSREGNDGFVPRLSVTVAFVMVLTCLGFFLAFIRHILSSMKVANAVSAIGQETLALAKKMYLVQEGDASLEQGPTWSPRPGDARQPVATTETGSIVWFDYRRLLNWATENDAVITVDRRVGEHIVEGQCVMRVWWDGELTEEDRKHLNAAVGVRMERTLTQDVGFGLRQLVDIADRALSPGTNDPTTAVQSVQELHRVLRYLVTCIEPSPYIAEDGGEDGGDIMGRPVRIVHLPQEITTLIEESVTEVHLYAEGSAQVPQALRSMVEDLLDATVPRYRSTLERLRALLAEEAEESEEADS